MPGAAALSAFAADVRAGLASEGQKTLPCRYFYDAVGSTLFQAITVLPEYGLTRADERIIRDHAAEMAALLPRPLALAELGSGDGSKTRWILEAIGGRPAYYAIDVSAPALEHCRRELADVAEVNPIEDSFAGGLRRAIGQRGSGEHFLALFLGSTIGNFQRHEAMRFLTEVRGTLAPGDAFLLGADLVKDTAAMLSAYDDPAGVTAAFNLNLLGRVNRELEADFDLRAFAHEARWSRRHRRIEMHLRARRAQRVRVRGAGIEVEFRRNETILTEYSHKFDATEICRMARACGFRTAAQWTDAEWPFAETLLV